MFTGIQLNGLAKSKNYGYAATLPFFKEREQVVFGPGLTILFGPNGSGKSTLLKIMAETTLALQGGISSITEVAIRGAVDLTSAMNGQKPRSKIGVVCHHDGQPVLYCDSRQAVGLAGGGFDGDFLQKGIVEAMRGRRDSHGERSLARIDGAMAVLAGRAPFPKKIEQRADYGGEMWQSAIALAKEGLKPTVEAGQPTVLLDEPEAGFSLVWQAKLWELLRDPVVAQRYQVIVATHSVFGLDVPGATYVDMTTGYREEALAAVRSARLLPAAA